VRALLLASDPALEVELLELTTRGDQILDRSLSKVGGKGLFVKELEVALVEGRADLAVHSLKDVPMELHESFALAAVLDRADPRDCVVSPRFAGLADLPAGAKVGTSSLRRELALRVLRPDVQILPVRGNVGTRLAKLDAGQFDALLMAAAGLQRLGMPERIAEFLSEDEFLPAPGQGALAIEIRAGDAATLRRVAFLEHPPTRAAVSAERAVSRALGGSCEVPLAAYARVDAAAGTLALRAWAGNAATAQRVDAQAYGPAEQAERIGLAVVAQLRAGGVERLLAR
jgi:hydroxymethylbilane synthase